ncbi:MAG TPA: hypothetical protein VEP90_20115, partial [Methylomirabilota bacterium]|nr:hypothetical protein [Methylomirabilota bacterium]
TIRLLQVTGIKLEEGVGTDLTKDVLAGNSRTTIRVCVTLWWITVLRTHQTRSEHLPLEPKAHVIT